MSTGYPLDMSIYMLPPSQSLALSHRSPSCEVSSSVSVSADLPSPPSQGLQPRRGLGSRRSFPRFLASTSSPCPRSRPASSLCPQQVHPDLYFWASFFFFCASLLSLPLLLSRIFPSIPCFVAVDLRSLCLLFLPRLSFNK